MGKKKKAVEQKSSPNFEHSFEKLQEIVTELEDGDLGLGESLEKYELGIQHLKTCYGALNAAESKIKMLVDLDANGDLVTSEFESTNEAPVDHNEESENRKSSDVDREVDEEPGLF